MKRMPRIDDIRRSKQPALPRQRQPKPTQLLKQIIRPVRVARTFKLPGFLRQLPQIKRRSRIARPYKLPSFFKLPLRFAWQHKIIATTAILIIAVIAGVVFVIKPIFFNSPDHEATYSEQLKQVVITDDTKLVVDFTFNLKMTINNQPQAIPANYGKTEGQKFIFNTDASNGDIHVQSPNKDDYRLSDFFILWGSQFNRKCLLNHCLGGAGTLTMTVNGKINPAFDSYIIKPNDQIVITYNDQPL